MMLNGVVRVNPNSRSGGRAIGQTDPHLLCVVMLMHRAVAVPAARLTAARPSTTTVSAGYVPDGLTQKQWDDMKKKKAAAVAARKKEVASKKSEVRRLGGLADHGFSVICCMNAEESSASVEPRTVRR